MQTMKLSIIVTLLVSVALLAGLLPSPAGAAFPGRNGRVVFVGGYFDQGLTTGCTDQSWHIYSVRTDGKGLRRLDEGVPYAGQPRWSPNRRWVAFNGGDGSSRGNEIYIVKSDGTDLTRLTNDEFLDAFPAWAPGGRQLVLQRGHTRIVVMKRDGTDRHTIGRIMRATGSIPQWSPDGGRIAYRGSPDGDNDLFTMRPDGTGVKRLTDWRSGVSNFNWSPSGRRLVVERSTERLQEIYTMKRNGSDKRLIYEGFRFGEFSWSPDGRRFIAIGTGDDCGYDLFVLNRSAEVQRRISIPNLSPNVPDWQPR